MRKQVIFYGLGLFILFSLLKYMEYSYLVKSFSQEFYIGSIAIIFTVLGIWTGIKWVNKKQRQPDISDLKTNAEIQKQLDLSNREMDVLIGMAEGLSNQQIASKLFLSESTIKTHSSNLYAKLNVNRRTQAIQKARELGLLN